MALAATPEQQAAVDGFRSGGNIVVEAAAGTGKTSTLRMIADAAPGKVGLYVAFNKAIATEAEQKFAGTGVTARTAHSLAYASHGRAMQHKLARGMRMRAAERAEILGIRHKIGIDGDNGAVTMLQRHVAARLAYETMNRFCHSADVELGREHVLIPPALMLDPSQEQSFIDTFVRLGRRYWENVTDPDGMLPVSHDAYLKQWALSNPVLNWDYILFDEAQDSDPVTAGVVRNQSHAQIVAVGDRSQSIYGWRGAVDSMDLFGGDIYQLTQSFRFGHAIADEANQWLDYLDASLRVRGSDKDSSVHVTNNRIPEAVLCRTNAGAIREVIDLLRRDGGSVAIGGKGKAKQLRDLAEAAKQLMEQGWSRHPEFDTFDSWEEVVEFSEEDEGADLAPLVKLVDRHGADFIIRAIDSTVDPRNARTVVSTAHTAKGLEWWHVRIADDFKVPNTDENGELAIVSAEEAMLAYVSVTRAVRHLDPGGLSWIRQYKRALARPEIGMEWRRRYLSERQHFADGQEVRAA